MLALFPLLAALASDYQLPPRPTATLEWHVVLSGSEQMVLRRKIIELYDTREKLAAFVEERLGKPFDYITSESDLETQAFEAIQYANARGILKKLFV